MTTLPPIRPEVEAALEEGASAIGRADRLVAVCHVGPDGDALGSLLAVGLSLRRLGREVVLGWGSEKLEVPNQYAFLPAVDSLTPPPLPGGDVALALDCATAERLGCVRSAIEATPTVVNVDHHVSNTLFGTIDVVDDDAPSTSELVLRLLHRLGAPIDADVATCLYTGLVTDTGRFGYASVAPRAHLAAAHLLEHGARPDVVSQSVYESLPYRYLKVLGRVLERAKLDPPMVITHLTRGDLEAQGLTLEDAESLIDDVRKIRDADVAVLLKEIGERQWRVSFRSKGATDVGAIAQRLGGGGHRLAAGATLELDLAAAVELIRSTLGEGRWSTGG